MVGTAEHWTFFYKIRIINSWSVIDNTERFKNDRGDYWLSCLCFVEKYMSKLIKGFFYQVIALKNPDILLQSITIMRC